MSALRAFALKARGREIAGVVVLDEGGDPCRPCGTCGGSAFHAAPGDPWRCSSCSPYASPTDWTDWRLCHVPEGAQA